ncbi:ADP-ribosylation factor family protein [Toxoplasma gondii TgCatPRC2]|uniref:ADP-ribosylation factor family protein n=16 Tax=Toxoplasma gondii TaxID=5811 RepID=A0A125YHK7_TOXGV|nr:ADP-ribosylation factor family protein [Toxoplasma gondii ME49]EPR59671.1 ADP-ribosylation factor family protein [Toxoplasma gondii GT1]ESS34005.1 ADP-ribosylation factor family protein [Toxoplasma gondii VEG]KAF4644576.1 ADP-ribosylation factor family protein [Toxoplasma gondii]KFG30848.1 ADP-ribosylation factor family protein [Toxoplasma gondii p89]KFG41665.1 ADP-ribosylation factor family protein [Toxoplasma gondii FOU]KFG42146.1 ADP-ribosylation factor family protein [Toxoplasma gondii|eukprot:XP_018636471.1 ADP-ribosylation factor family protein [Toxoplasma gondii ME49]
MGNALSNGIQSGLSMCCSKNVYQIRVAGPAQAGKTSIIKWMKYRQFFKLAPTEGLEVDRVDYPDTALVMWDTRQHFEDMVRPHHLDIRGIIYVVDSSDPGRLRIATRALDRLLRDLPDASVLLVFAAKQDRPGAMSVADIQHQLQLQQLVDKECGVFACSAKTGEGIDEGIAWLVRQLRQQDGTGCCSADQAIPCFLQQVPS